MSAIEIFHLGQRESGKFTVDLKPNFAQMRKGEIKRLNAVKGLATIVLGKVPLMKLGGCSHLSEEYLKKVEVYVYGNLPNVDVYVHFPFCNTDATLQQRND